MNVFDYDMLADCFVLSLHRQMGAYCNAVIAVRCQSLKYVVKWERLNGVLLLHMSASFESTDVMRKVWSG